MYIKYLGNIHNLKRYDSINKAKSNVKCIGLHKDDSYISLEFYNEEARDFILDQIWSYIKEGEKFFDIDEVNTTFYEANKYKLV